MSTVVNPTVAQFRERFAEFADPEKYTDEQLQAQLEMAQCIISPANFGPLKGKCRLQAIYLMTAHMQLLDDRARAASGGGLTGFTTSASIDRVSVSVAPPPSKDQWSYWLNLTPYGMKLAALLASRAAVGFYFGGEYEQVFR